MKELTIKEKAQRYDEAIERAKEYYNVDVDNTLPVYAKGTIEYIFPELTESEDEKIKKNLIGYIKGISKNEVCEETKNSWLAWLEKQGEHANFLSKIQVGDKVTRNEDGMLVNLSQLKRVAKPAEKQGKQMDNLTQQEAMDIAVAKCFNEGEQKPADKVKPKFHKDDWIVHQGTENIYQVVACVDNHYELKYGDNYTVQKCADVDKCARLWDVSKDAKDGDVLYLQKDGKEHIIIYKGVLKERFRTFVSAYCAYNGIVDAFCFADVSKYVDIAYRGIMPATKEQRDTLFAKMKEAGYEWSSEHRKLIKRE